MSKRVKLVEKGPFEKSGPGLDFGDFFLSFNLVPVVAWTCQLSESSWVHAFTQACVHACVLYPPHAYKYVYTRRVQPTPTPVIAKSPRSPCTVLVAGALVHLQTFAYKYTGYHDGWYAD